jgi:hypothetical protein
MFTVFADTLDGSHSDIYVQCETLEEALKQLRKLIEREMSEPGGPVFDRYGIYVREKPS